MRDRSNSVVVLILALLCAYLVKWLINTTNTESISSDLVKQMTKEYSKTFSEVTKGVTDLAETLILGRDLPSPSESLPTSGIETPSETPPSIDLSDLPETARWAAEAEQEVLTTMPWQSSTLPGDLEN